MNSLCKMTLALAITLGLAVRSAIADSPIPVTSESVKGQWMESFTAAKALADSTHSPLVLFWASKDCKYCGYLEDAVKSNQFKTWMAAHPDFVYCFVYSDSRNGDTGVNANSGAMDFARYEPYTLREFPFICLYLSKPDGTTYKNNFTGRSGSMPATEGSLAEQFEKSIEQAFADYSPEPVPDEYSFLTSGGLCDRLEAEEATAYVDVPVRRKINNGGKQTTTLIATWPDALAVERSYSISWEPAETEKLVRVNLDRGAAAFPAGKTMTLRHIDSGDKAISTTISFVAAQGNSVVNPKWIGEDFEYGEWTFDYEAAKQKDGHVLALFSGVLWCPYCYGMENSLLASGAFSQWAKDNKVSLVLFDQSRASTPATAAGSGLARLLSYDAGASSTHGEGGAASGAGYLSRKSIAQEAAQAVVDLTTKYTAEWMTPESTAARLGNPTLLLVKNDKVIARFAPLRNNNKAVFPAIDDDKYYDPDENIARLDDLLLLAGRTDDLDSYASTTRLTLAANDEAEVTLQINDSSRAYRLTGLSSGLLAICADAGKDVALTLLQGTTELASGVNTLEYKVRGSVVNAGAIYLRVRAYSGTTAVTGGHTSFTAKITSALESTVVNEASCYKGFASATVLQEVDAPSDARVAVRKTSGVLPAGLRLVYDKTTSSIVLSGTPAKAVSATIEYQVTINNVKQDVESVRIEVADPMEYNPYLSQRVDAAIPLYANDETGEAVLAGCIAFTQMANNRLMARYTGTGKRGLLFSGSWQELDEEGTAFAAITLRTGQSIELELDPNGHVRAGIYGLDADYTTFGTAEIGGEAALGGGALDAFAGYYTVTLPVVRSSDGALSSGTGYMTLTMTAASAIKQGRVSFIGMMPDGARIGGSATMTVDPSNPGYALLPILVHRAKSTFSAVLRIQANGESLYSDEETARVVLSGPAAAFYDNGSERHYLNVYGGWYKKNTGFAQWLDMFNLPDGLSAKADISLYSAGDYGEIAVEPEAAIALGVNDRLVVSDVAGGRGMVFRASFVKATGVISGSATILFENGRRLTGVWSGVLLPGWIDCGCSAEPQTERPFASGTLYFTDRIGNRTVRRGVPIDIAVAAETP